MSREIPRTTTFRLQCQAEQVFLHLRPENGSFQAIPLQNHGPQDWRIELDLLPGIYRFRYYYVANGGTLMLYHPPVDGTTPLDGLDGVLCVGEEPPAA